MVGGGPGIFNSIPDNFRIGTISLDRAFVISGEGTDAIFHTMDFEKRLSPGMDGHNCINHHLEHFLVLTFSPFAQPQFCHLAEGSEVSFDKDVGVHSSG